MKDLRIEKRAGEDVFTLHRADRWSSTLVVLLVAGAFLANRFAREGSVYAAVVSILASPLVIVAVLLGLFLGWRWTRHDVIRVNDHAITFERRVGLASLDSSMEIDRHQLTGIELRETKFKAKGHPYLFRQLIFLEGANELARTLHMSVGTARQLVEASLFWPVGTDVGCGSENRVGTMKENPDDR
jgi:hypothetical protein